MSEINKRVTHYRKEARLTQVQVADLIGMKSSSYSQMERLGDISAERIVKLAEVFKIDVRLLLYGQETESPQEPQQPEETETVVLPKLPFGMTYIPLKNLERSIITIFRHLTAKQQKSVCNVLDYLRKSKKTKLPTIFNE